MDVIYTFVSNVTSYYIFSPIEERGSRYFLDPPVLIVGRYFMHNFQKQSVAHICGESRHTCIPNVITMTLVHTLTC